MHVYVYICRYEYIRQILHVYISNLVYDIDAVFMFRTCAYDWANRQVTELAELGKLHASCR